MNDNTEIISDDDVSDEELVDKVIDLEKAEKVRLNKTSKRIETIVIDDELPDNNNITQKGEDITLDINKIYNENKLLAQFIEKCLNLEISDGMLRIIKRTLLRAYDESDVKYKKSPEFERLLQKQINFIEVQPHRKFNHIKNLVEALKANGVKKRVKLTTLATNLKKKVNNNLQNKRPAAFGERNVKRSKKDEIIDLDSEPNDEPVINLDDDQNDVIMLDDTIILDDEKENLEISKVNQEVANKKDESIILDDEKENFVISKANKKDDNNRTPNSQNNSEENMFLTPQIEVIVPNNVSEQNINEETDDSHISNHNGPSDIPITAENATITEDNERRSVEKQIRSIEKQIEKCKQILEQLDETEVENDSLNSPYILSEKVKAQIVKLYKKLCELTGSDSVKMRTVRLQVQEGHPAGPVRRLEEFINSHLGEDGDPMFPDFSDVTMCVLKANTEDKLGWSRAQVLREASALFTQCGRALQKRRQRREWRDLLATVKTEALEYDPADEDPALAARLEQNRRLAHCKETEILERYSRMQDMPALSKSKQPSLVTQNGNGSENMSLQNKSHTNTVNEQEVPLENNGNHELLAPTVDETDSNVPNYSQNSIVIIKTEVSVEFENPEASLQTTCDSTEPLSLETGEEILSNNLQTLSDSKESIHLETGGGDIIPYSQRLKMDEDEFKLRIKTETEGSQCSEGKDPDIIPYSQRLQMDEDEFKLRIKTETEGSQCSEGKDPDIIPYSQRLQMDEDEFKLQIKTEIEGSQCSEGKDPYSSEDLPNFETTSSQDDANEENHQMFCEENNEIENVNENNINKEVSNVDGDQIKDNVAKNPTDNRAGDSSFVNEETNIAAVRVKKEPVDIATLLDGLGDNFSVDIVDIQDPSLVIEISDSSDEE